MLIVDCPCGARYVLDAETLPVEDRLAAFSRAVAFALEHKPHVDAANRKAAEE